MYGQWESSLVDFSAAVTIIGRKGQNIIFKAYNR